jgi:hypothetical protein
MSKSVEVFTPNKVPTITYVERDDRAEQNARQAFQIPNIIVSLSGPSKSGKTVLVNKVVPKDHLIEVSGAAVKSAEDLWTKVIAWMGGPVEETSTVTNTQGNTTGANASGGFNVLVVSGKVEGKVDFKDETTTSASSKIVKTPVIEVVREIGNSEFVVFIDDFHYIPKEAQPEIGRQIKYAAEQGVRICTASVPHRSDDVVRSNTELRGRVMAVNIQYWSPTEQRKIAENGFAALNMKVPSFVIERFIAEAFGSPQLMQTMCLNLCFRQGVMDTLPEVTTFVVEQHLLSEVLEYTSNFMDFVSLIEALHSGPKQRGNDRKEFQFIDGSKGDVYRAILMAVAGNPPRLSINYDEMLRRVRGAISTGEGPTGSSVAQALTQMDVIASRIQPSAKVVEWDENVLDIVDPYFLFFLRSAPIMRNLHMRTNNVGALIDVPAAINKS